MRTARRKTPRRRHQSCENEILSPTAQATRLGRRAAPADGRTHDPGRRRHARSGPRGSGRRPVTALPRGPGTRPGRPGTSPAVPALPTGLSLGPTGQRPRKEAWRRPRWAPGERAASPRRGGGSSLHPVSQTRPRPADTGHTAAGPDSGSSHARRGASGGSVCGSVCRPVRAGPARGAAQVSAVPGSNPADGHAAGEAAIASAADRRHPAPTVRPRVPGAPAFRQRQADDLRAEERARGDRHRVPQPARPRGRKGAGCSPGRGRGRGSGWPPSPTPWAAPAVAPAGRAAPGALTGETADAACSLGPSDGHLGAA